MNGSTSRLNEIAPSADAIADELTDWSRRGDGRWSRVWESSSTAVTLASSRTVFVDLDGEQLDDGSIVRTIAVQGDPQGMSAAEARQVAEALLAAAEELERLTAVDGGG